MKRAILYGSIIVTAILFGGCAQQNSAAIPPKTIAKMVASTPTPTAKATPVVKAEDPEVKAVTDELNKLDSSKDFMPYTSADIQ